MSPQQCSELARLLPGQVALPNSTAYATSNYYWSARQSEVHPGCFVTPGTAQDVSNILKTLSNGGTRFTVKGGGHSTFPGGSNIQDGVTIDMGRMAGVELAEDFQSVSVGPGARWINVSSVLDPLGRAVVGGRVSDVGVSGLILGGGISYFSGRRGWACDNVLRYEIVLASGDIITASPTEHADLYRALRGGGGKSFGIVSRFDLEVFPQGDMWSTMVFTSADSFRDGILPEMADLIDNGLVEDLDAHVFGGYTFLPDMGGFVGFANAYHAKPSEEAPKTTPKVFENLVRVPSLTNSTIVANSSTHMLALNEAYGGRAAWWVTSVKADLKLMRELLPILERFAHTVAPVTPFLIFQPLTTETLAQMQRNGGNVLGLKPEDGPVWNVQVTARWAGDAGMDAVVDDASRKAIFEIEAAAEKRGLLQGYKYVNYAGQGQDVFASYGAGNHRELRRVARKYDPEGVLRDLWEGYFGMD